MIAASITTTDLFVGEMLFCGTKGLFFSGAVLSVIYPFGLIPSPVGLLAPLGGFFTGVMFAALGLYVTSWVTSINQFNFYFTGMVTPMFFFSGIVFPLESLPAILRPLAELMPLTHSARLFRALCLDRFDLPVLFSFGYIVIFTLAVGRAAVTRLTGRLVT
jgi:lipooligosaccharide transport system permease protein